MPRKNIVMKTLFSMDPKHGEGGRSTPSGCKETLLHVGMGLEAKLKEARERKIRRPAKSFGFMFW